MPILRILRSTVTPCVRIGTTISDLLRWGAPSEVVARQHIQSACAPLVIQSLPPFST
jgi:hypothetical protein